MLDKTCCKPLIGFRLVVGMTTVRVRHVKTAIWDARSKWTAIGRALDLSPGDITSIHGNDDGDRLNEVLLKWMQGNSNPTIGDILEAMEDVELTRIDIANKIRGRKWNESAKVVQ